MTDETRPDDDGRDERVAAALDVPPLDDVTRRRLVRRALDESAGTTVRTGRPTRLLAVAAAVLAVLVIGGGTVLVLRDDGDDSTTIAGRNEDARGAAEAEDAAAPAAAPDPLGDLGEISDPAVLRTRIAAGTEAPLPATGETLMDTLCSLDAEQIGGPEAGMSAFGHGTYRGVQALIVVVSTDAGRTAFVLEAASCEPLAEVPL